MTFRVGAVAVVSANTVLLTMSGCAQEKGEDPDMDYFTARAEMDSLLTTVQDLIGGEWESADRGAGPCPLPSGDTGAQAPLARSGQGVPKERKEALVDQVTALWTEAGFPPVRNEKPLSDGNARITLAYPESGVGQDRVYIPLTVSELASTVDGQTRCVPGDADTLD